jgi:curved DNA-binding protein CbpA
MQSEQNFYTILGVPPSASIEEIRHAYRKLAFQHHPDRNQMNPTASQIMERLNEAYTIISDPVKREEYDLARGYRAIVPKFNKGSYVRINSNSTSPYKDHSGVVDQEPLKDTFRFWYMVKFQSKGLSTIVRIPEEELELVRE